jgi:hypothetical protein
MTRYPESLHHVVDDMLIDAGQSGDSGLRGILLSLGSLASLPAPAPSGQLALLMAGSATEAAETAAPRSDGREVDQGAAADELARRRRLRRHRPTILGLALLAGMGTGIGGVAAGSPAPGGASHSVQQLLENWSPSWTIQGQAAAGLLQPDDPDNFDDTGAGQPAAEPVSAGRGTADSQPLQQDHIPGPPQAAAPHPSAVASGEPGKAPRALAGGKEPGRRNPAAGAATARGGGQGQPGGGNAVPGVAGEPADEAVLPPVTIVAEPLKDVVLQTEDAIGEVAEPLRGNRWLQKFSR